jgi:alpha-tubulin suppressor-like RCC1 family protein
MPVNVSVNNLNISKKKISKIACGAQHSVALSSDGIVYTWGANTNGK